MKIETLLSALCLSKGRPEVRRFRQFNKFYDRILRLDDYKNEQEAMLRLEIDELYYTVEEKVAEIARLEKFIEDHTQTLANGWVIQGGRR